MKGDFTRQTFNRKKHYSEVLFQQGRIQLDADLNEQQDILRDSMRTEAHDVIGWAGYPKYGGGFEISVTDQGEDLTVSPGRYYVDGILCVAETSPITIRSINTRLLTVDRLPAKLLEKENWFEIRTDEGLVWRRRAEKLEEGKSAIYLDRDLKRTDLSKIPETSRLILRLLPSYLHQPDLPVVPQPSDLQNGVYLVYLDVWERLITPIDDPDIREKGLGGPDTAARAKVIWQVKLEKAADNAACSQFGQNWEPAEAVTDGKLNVRTAPVPDAKDPCILPGQSGYRGVENQLYRVEIHQGGKIGTDGVTFKWSRDNGSVVTGIDDITGAILTVSGLGPDEVHGFSNGQWCEIVDDAIELNQNCGPFAKIASADHTTNTVELTQAPAFAFDKTRHCKLRRWDCDGLCKAEVPPTNDGWIALENGLEIKFSAGKTFRTGEYWLIPARTAVGSENGSLEWPQEADKSTIPQPPHGIQHHYAPLALVTVESGRFQVPLVSDCRNIFPPLIEVGEGSASKYGSCCTFVVGDGLSTHGDFDDIEEALLHLPEDGGQLCLLPGDHQVNAVIKEKQNIIITGCGYRTTVSPRVSNPEDPVFTVAGSSRILFSDFCIASYEGMAIVMDASETVQSRDIHVENCCILGYTAAIHVQEAIQVAIRNNQIQVLDRQAGGVAIYMAACDSVIERNDIALSRSREKIPEVKIPGIERNFNPQDDCADFETLYKNRKSYAYLTGSIFAKGRETEIETIEYVLFTARAQGGIQIAAGSERIRIRDNRIQGGTGNGITLGGWNPLQTTAAEQPADTPVVVHHPGGIFIGTVQKGESVQPGVALRITSQDTRETFTSVTNTGGSFRIANLAAGQYSIAILSPGSRVTKVSENRSARENLIFVEEIPAVEDQDLAKRLAFLREILIEDNRIYRMGLSGIGTSGVAPADNQETANPALLQRRASLLRILEIYGNPILNLIIVRNHIAGCMSAGITRELAAQLRTKGFGGISIGICEDLSITENRIEHNGVIPLPVSAIFVGYGEHVDISLNRIQQNGAVPLAFKGDLLPGVRGGIFILMGSCLLDPEADESSLFSTSRGQFAVRVHGNTVSQPVGRALTLGAIGPVAVQDNYFDSHACMPGLLNQAGGAVCIVNLGRPSGREKQTDSVPGGAVLFSSNQSRVGAFHASPLPHLILSLDDVDFGGNQLRSSQAISAGFINALVWSATARVTANRFQETQAGRAASLVSWARKMNITTGNQADNCIFVYCGDTNRLIKTGNHTLAEDCEKVSGIVEKALMVLAKRGDV
ncbi:MAG: right-handed parallel beta-helix repeat-containing protein [Acidobacteria bacterium]|nr:right-handed parallel beta-helix repeat-containing protein [Acidobacteriota bacterium]